MTFFPASVQLSTKAWLFVLLQMGTLNAMLHCVSHLFFTSMYVYDAEKGNDQVRVGIDLFGGGARLPICDVRDETGLSP